MQNRYSSNKLGFLASDFILDEELPKMLQAVVMPVILRPSRFERSGIISTFQSVNSPSSPLSGLRRNQWEKFLPTSLTSSMTPSAGGD
jgi:hypothetical protein